MTSQDQEDEALEAQLRAYRPARPPERLREAVLGLTGGRRSTRLPGWLTLAALLLLAITLRWSARSDNALASERALDVVLLAPPILEVGVDQRAFGLQFWAVGERTRSDGIRPLMDPRLMGVER